MADRSGAQIPLPLVKNIWAGGGMADAQVLKTCEFTLVRVRLPPGPPKVFTDANREPQAASTPASPPQIPPGLQLQSGHIFFSLLPTPRSKPVFRLLALPPDSQPNR